MYFNWRLWRFTEAVRGRIWLSALIGVLSSAFGIARLALLGWLLALVFQEAPLDALVGPGLLTVLAIVARGILEYLRIMIAHHTAAKVQTSLRVMLYDKLMELGTTYLGRTRTGDVVVTLVQAIEQLEIYFGQYLPQLLIAVITPALIFAFIAFIDPFVAIAFLAAALFTLLAPLIFHRWDEQASLERSKSYADFASELLDSIQGLATLKAFGQSGARAKLLAKKADDLFRATMWVLATNSLTRGITDTGITVGAAAGLAVGVARFHGGELGLEGLMVILLLGTEVFRPLRDLRGMLHAGMLSQSAATKVLGLLNATPAIAEPNKGLARNEGQLSSGFAFRNVTFSYPGGRGMTHKNLDFSVEAGERIGLVGTSGAGKSSVVRLLLRLYDPQEGHIQIGGRDLTSLSFNEIRSQFAIVSQDTFLFHGTVAENLRVGKPDATQEELAEAARIANAHEFIADLPEGFDTMIGERGMKLSGGQRQRIAIARAMLRDTPILILDEALSSVDAENEAVIQEALDRLMQGRTTLILAHRLSSVIDCDRILVLDRGAVVESGRHDDLMARRGTYFELMGEQAAAGAGGQPMLDAIPQTVDEQSAENAVEFPHRADGYEEDSAVRAEGLGWIGAIGKLMTLIAPWTGRLVMTFLFGIGRVAAYIAVGLVSALVIAAVKTGDPTFALLAILFALAPTAGILHWLESWVAHDMAFRLLAIMRIDLFRKVDSLAPAYLVRRRTGDLVAMATEDVEMVEYFFAHTIAPAFVAVVLPTLAVVVLGWMHWGLAAALLPFLLLVALSPFAMRARLDRLASKDREALGELNAHAVDSVQGLGEIVAYQQEAVRRAAFQKLTDTHQSARLPFFSDLTIQKSLIEVATSLGGLSVVLTGGYLATAGLIDPLYLPLLTLLAMAAFLPISEIADIGRQLADTLGATRRLHAVHSEPVPVVDGPIDNVPMLPGGTGVAFKGVSFTYPGTSRSAVRSIDLDIPAGKTVALVGPSGAGKSTLAHLLLRFWDPAMGDIRVGGTDLRDFQLDLLRRQVALVAQDTYLFNDTLRANILIARPGATEPEIADAIRRAALEPFIATLPDGLETQVGERGMALSGGQRQRVAIARAFLRDAPVLVLDEATSHLDAASERLVHEALRDLMQDRTTIVIAHRLSTVRAADKIAVLSQGRLAESGDHASLMAKGGLYARLVARQSTVARTAAE